MNDLERKETALWQPIETAPKDDGWLLLFGDGVGFMKCTFVGYWGEYISGGSAFKESGTPHWRRAFGGDITQPTHWMPLPEPPKSKE